MFILSFWSGQEFSVTIRLAFGYHPVNSLVLDRVSARIHWISKKAFLHFTRELSRKCPCDYFWQYLIKNDICLILVWSFLKNYNRDEVIKICTTELMSLILFIIYGIKTEYPNKRTKITHCCRLNYVSSCINMLYISSEFWVETSRKSSWWSFVPTKSEKTLFLCLRSTACNFYRIIIIHYHNHVICMIRNRYIYIYIYICIIYTTCCFNLNISWI
jgi:hypothetical protein